MVHCSNCVDSPIQTRLFSPFCDESSHKKGNFRIITPPFERREGESTVVDLDPLTTMGKRIIPPNDPDRLARIMDEKKRVMGVDVAELDRQRRDKQRHEKQVLMENLSQDLQQIHWEQEVLRRYAEAQACQRTLDHYVAEKQRQQALDKHKRDAYLQELYSNRIEESYFKQFGTSHR